MESQEVKTNPSAERREGNIPINNEPKSSSVEKDAPVASPDMTKKVKEPKSDKKANGKTSKKDKKTKSSKSKKATSAGSESSSSGGDEITNSSSDDATESESESASEIEENLKKKRPQKKRQDVRKAKKKPSKSSKAVTKPAKSQNKASETDTSDSDTAASDDSDADKKAGASKASLEQELAQMRLQVQQMQRQIASFGLAGGAPGINGAPTLNAGAYGAGALAGSGLNPMVSGNMGGLGYSGLNPIGGGNIGIGGNDDPYNFRRYFRNIKSNAPPPTGRRRSPPDDFDLDDDTSFGTQTKSLRSKSSGRNGKSVSQRLEFKRVDQVWDSQIHNYKLQDTAENANNSQYDEYLFHVRRTFDWEGKYKTTIVDIKSKQLREALQDVIGSVKGVSLVEETPKLDPKMLFLYLEDMREHMNNLKHLEPEGDSRKERKKVQKWIDEKRRHLRILIKYLDTDHAETKKSLYPMLENGLITFDLLWALWKPNTLAYTTTYGSVDEPRVFKVDVAEKHYSIVRGEFYYIEGKYFEYDGKQFGFGSMSEEIPEFRGARKITSLGCYPLKYHKNETQLRKDLIDRGKKFVGLGGVHYKSHHGMAYHKKKKSVIKVNINGRIMVDPAIHRRINPNYPVSLVRPKDHDVLSDDDDSDEEGEGCGCEESDDDAGDAGLEEVEGDNECGGKVKYVTKVIKDNKGQVHQVRIPKDYVDVEPPKEKLDQVSSKNEEGKEESKKDGEEDAEGDNKDSTPPVFSDEEYLIASPVVLGFAFAEKLWLEFTVSGIKEITWNEHAYDSLVLQPNTKEIVKALVESHKYHPAESIDDVIQGKGKGLVAVLHGPPGTGKTLTAEGISELLKCPLYMVSAGDLGTDSRYLEAELQKILDICHAWGAILLLDEADVFLEKRNMQDIHRNALVSIFLRQLEYFQGILFLTTNRVQTFDDAFQSRIHIALRYDDLDAKAKKAIFKIFVERARVVTGVDTMPFNEEDYTSLARHNLNGRQIKNTIGTAQALAVNKGEPLSMRHIREVLNVQQNFAQDLKGGTGYEDAMRSYF
ncbi:Calcium channel yvc1 [Hypoxylon texense]